MMKLAAIQMVSTPDPAQNLATAERLIRQAAAEGARLVLLPEYWALLGLHETDKCAIAEVDGHGPLQGFMAALAGELKLWLVGGSIALQSDTVDKVLNSTLVYAPDGQRCARYDKMHLFGFQNDSESYQEARTIVPGNEVASFETEAGRVGLSICYDLRFPELYRALGDCRLLLVPAAFTHTTGAAHWEILLRARAIENQCYVLACGQGGLHLNGRRTWGHSMLIDPWGKVLACLDEGEGVVGGVLDAAVLAQVRASLPAWQHRRL